MSEAQVVNMMLHRKLESGSQYSRLIPNYLSIRHSFELPADYSDTYDTLEFMAFWTEKYASQFQKVANVLKGKNVLETVQNNYNFLYKHFQYKIDENLQQIYAPSAAWHFRKVGFDCKTFSVLAMALLLCQNIEASFVKVKLPGSNDWSHVYVQIPYQGSYLIIDATTHDNKEVDFIEKHEFSMKNLKHIGLASPYMDTPYLNPESPSLSCPGQVCSCSSVGLSSPYELPIYSQKNGLNGIVDDGISMATDFGSNLISQGIDSVFNQGINFVTSLFSGLDCWGGTAYENKYLKNNIKLINAYFINYIEDINHCALNDQDNLGDAVANFKGFAKLLDASFRKSKSTGWNSCSTANFNSTIKVTEFYKSTGIAALDAWLNKFFTKGSSKENKIFKNYKSLTEGFEDGEGFWGTSAGGAETVVITEPNYTYTLKVKENIPAFELTTYALESHKSNDFTDTKYISSLQKVLNIFDLTTGNTNSSNGTTTTSSGAPSSTSNLPKSSTSISPMKIAGTGLLIAGVFFGISKLK